jgi:hypothetical protein
MQVNPWRYAPTGHWNDVLLPPTKCPFPGDDRKSWGPRIALNNTHEENHTVFAEIVDWYPTVFEPPAMPFDVQQAVRLFHARPEVWWVGVLAKFLLRPSEASVERQAAVPGFGGRSPVVGVHVRRTDKVTVREAKPYDVSEYMQHVERYCDSRLPSGWQKGLENGTDECLVYLATEEPAVLHEVKQGYPHIRLVGNDDVAALEAKVKDRNSFGSLLGIYDDVIHLSRAHFLVGTLSSQVSRLAYEIMQHRTSVVDASFNYHSLDSVWYLGGQQELRYCATTDFTDGGRQVLHKDDELQCQVIVPNLNGSLVCKSKRLGSEVKFPAGLVDWCPRPVEDFHFRDLLSPYMSKAFHERE